jgi:hypothetical protein
MRKGVLVMIISSISHFYGQLRRKRVAIRCDIFNDDSKEYQNDLFLVEPCGSEEVRGGQRSKFILE